MSNRQRQRRITIETDTSSETQISRDISDKFRFMEEVNYRMDMETTESKQVEVGSDQPSEEQKR